MLNQLRNLTKTWVASVFVALLVASFAVWGVSDIFAGRSADAVVVVGKDEISVNRFAIEFDRELRRVSEQSSTALDRTLAVQLGLDRAILERLAVRSAMEQKGRALGLAASEAAVARELRTQEGFIDPITGRFDRDTYLGLLREAGMTPAQFEADVRIDLTQRQLQTTLGSGVRPPDVLAGARLRYERETRAFSVVRIPADAAGQIADPTPEQLAAFYAEREASYAIPPQRAFSLVTLAVEDFVLDVEVDEELVRQMYEQRSDLLRTPERRDVVELAAPDETTAQEVARRLRAGEEPAAVAEALGLAPPNSYDDALPSDLLTREVGAAAFAVAAGDITDPIDGRIAWFVAKVGDVTAGVEQSFEEARPALELELARDAAGERLFDAIDAFEAARDQGATVEEAAVAAGVPVFVYGLLDSNGASLTGQLAPQLQDHPEILRAVFSAPAAGVAGQLEDLGEDGYFVVRVDEIAPATVRPLEDVESEVRAQYALVKRSEALDALAETARNRLADGASASEAATAASPAARGEISEVRRDQPTPTLDRNLLARAFTLRTGDVTVGATADGGRLALRVDAITPADDQPAEALELQRGRLAQELGGDLSQLYVADLQRVYPIRVDQQLLSQATGVDSPS